MSGLPGRALYVRDEDEGAGLDPDGVADRQVSPYVVSHCHGYSRFEHVSRGIAPGLLQYVPPDDPIKISRLTITNQSGRAHQLAITTYVGWVLGPSRPLPPRSS